MTKNFKNLEDAAFPLNLTDKNGIWQNGMSKRFYAACAAMRISHELIDVKITEDDIVQDNDGCVVKFSDTDGYFSSSHPELRSPDQRFRIVSTYSKRYVRALYEIADELLKQEHNDKEN